MSEGPRVKSFQEILQQNQEFVSRLEGLQADVAEQLDEKEQELATTRAQLEDKQKDLDELQNAQLQWAIDRQGLLDLHEGLKQNHQDLQGRQDRAQTELVGLHEDVARAQARDAERRAQLRELEERGARLSEKYEADQKKLLAEHKTLQADLESLQAAQLQWAIDREGLIKGRDAAVAKQAELEPLKAAQDRWQAERHRLIADVARVEQDAQTAAAQYKADRKLLQSDLDEARAKAAGLSRAEADGQRLTEERAALLAKVRALEKDWQAREASFAEERAGLRKQVQEAGAKQAAMQQDYEKVKALHEDLAGETGRKAEQSTAREQRLTSEKNQLKVDLERVQAQLSEMANQTNELHKRKQAEVTELELAWQREKASLKAQLEEARKAAGADAPQSQVIARYESEKRALQAQMDSLRHEVMASGKNKEAAPALVQAKRDFEAKFRVIYDQSHDLNSPLNAIIGFSEILMDEKGNKTTPEERREFVSHINESGKRLVEHIRELIEFAKQESGIQEKPVQVTPLAGMPNSKAPVILVADNDPAVKERIEPFLSHAGYEVVVAASAQDALKKAVQLRPLAVLIDTQLPPKGGNGLLYDLKRESKTRDIPVVLTSKVNKESLPFDIGQADFLTKPIDRQQLLQMMVKFDLLADGKGGKKAPSSILIVDDDPQNIRLVKAMLKPFNMDVTVADGGKAGLEIALKKKPDLIILDLMMPDVDGFEVVSRLRKDAAGSQIPILIYTAKNVTSEDRERLQGNIQSIIQKGDFGKDRFLEMINNLHNSRAA